MASVNTLPAVAAGKNRRKLSASDVTENDLKLISDHAWVQLIGLVAGGVRTAEAVQRVGISRMAIDGTLRTNPKRKEQWEDARTASLRTVWDEDSFEEALARIAGGSTVRQACAAVFKEDETNAFYKLVLSDAVMKSMYDEARMVQAEKMAIDDLIEISDDGSQDETWDGKPNSAAVNRSRLKTDTRKWIASKLHYKKFGDKIQQDVNANIVVDHAARLEAARKRKEQAHAKEKVAHNSSKTREERVING